MSRIKRIVRRVVLKIAEVSGVDRTAIAAGQLLGIKLSEKSYLPNLAQAEFSVFSQWGEDGILSWMIDRIGVETDNFVEFGVEHFREANCRYLLMTRNWRGLVIDGSIDNINEIKGSTIAWKYDLQAIPAFITKDNIEGLISGAGFGSRIGVLSVDIDGVDYWILEKIKVVADIVIVEYNDLFSGHAVSVPYSEDFDRLKKHPSGMYWGASLDAFKWLLESRGYTFVGSNRAGTNAFFVANEHRGVMSESLGEFLAWPCRMREVRNDDGSLALKTYRESAFRIENLPLVDVVTGDEISVMHVLS